MTTDITTTTQDVSVSVSVSGAHIKDLAIKLFGRTIPLPDSKDNLKQAEQLVSSAENSCPSERSSVLVNNEEIRVSNLTNKVETVDTPRCKDEQAADANCAEQERVFKKPDKIIPCPRCNSFETKFCYFNNYNVNQPRHFCKNCQRYWTAGGTMRNVPIGAGRRRNKQLASQYRQIIVSSEGVATTRMENSDSTNNHHQLISCVDSSTSLRPSTGNGTVLKFGPPEAESMETVLSLGDQKRCMELGSTYCGDSPEEPSSCGSSMTTTSVRGNELTKSVVVEREAVRLSGPCSDVTASNTMPCYPVPQLVFPLNHGGNSVVSPAPVQGSDCMSKPNVGNRPANAVQWLPATMLAVPGFCTPSLPLQFVPASCWGCTPVWTSGNGNLTKLPSNACAPDHPSTTTGEIYPVTPSSTLGKHSRDANSLTEDEKLEKCVVVPKTLRVDNPNEASRSPIWATLGIRPYTNESVSKGSVVFETSESNGDGKGHFMDAKTSSFYSSLL